MNQRKIGERKDEQSNFNGTFNKRSRGKIHLWRKFIGNCQIHAGVDRKIRKDGDATADFIPCVVFGRSAEFVEKYFRKGLKIAIVGHVQTGSYTNRDGQNVYTTEVVVEEQEFAESKNSGSGSSQQNAPQPSPDVGQDGFMNIPDGIEEELPFS